MTTAQQQTRLGKKTALISFLGGTLIFLFYFLTSSDTFLFLGYAYIAIVGLINLGVLISLLIIGYKDKTERKNMTKTCGLMLLNIPVMLFYCWLSIIVLNTIRITFVNTTKFELTDIQIIGCEPRHLDKLEPGQSKTVWVAITGDCYIDIEYIANGQKKSESVSGYCTNDMGQKITYQIGADHRSIDNL